jgi:peptidoglycan/xylan/chitin deacetylase (PgdA/CDA1 family)
VGNEKSNLLKRPLTLTKAAKAMGSYVLSAAGLPRLLHSQFYRRQLTILMYHGVVRTPLPVEDLCFIEERSFRAQVAYLKQHLCVLPFSVAVERLKRDAIDQPSVVLTFDDGYQNNCDIAFPILRDYGVPATIFLTTGLIDSTDTIWFCRLIQALSRTRKQSIQWAQTDLDISGPVQKARVSLVLQQSLKEYPPSSINSMLSEIYDKLGAWPEPAFEAGSPFQMLSSGAIQSMLSSGLIEFGAHTHTHPILSLIPRDERHKEIAQSLQIVSQLTGERCKLFAYPNGRAQDYDEYCMELLKLSDVEAAVSTIAGHNDASTPVMELRRYAVGPNITTPYFQLLVHHFIHKVRGI